MIFTTFEIVEINQASEIAILGTLCVEVREPQNKNLMLVKLSFD